MTKNYYGLLTFFLLLGLAIGTENYMDYGDDNNADRDLENLRGLYKYILQRNSMDNLKSSVPENFPYQHLMIRKSQRSPSLRLRFGRSDPAMSPMGLLTKSGSNAHTFENN